MVLVRILDDDLGFACGRMLLRVLFVLGDDLLDRDALELRLTLSFLALDLFVVREVLVVLGVCVRLVRLCVGSRVELLCRRVEGLSQRRSRAKLAYLRDAKRTLNTAEISTHVVVLIGLTRHVPLSTS